MNKNKSHACQSCFPPLKNIDDRQQLLCCDCVSPPVPPVLSLLLRSLSLSLPACDDSVRLLSLFSCSHQLRTAPGRPPHPLLSPLISIPLRLPQTSPSLSAGALLGWSPPHTRTQTHSFSSFFPAHQTSSHRSFAQPIVLSSTSNVHVCISLSVLWNASTPSDPSGLIHHAGPCAQMCGVSSSVAHCCISVHFNGDGETKKVFFFFFSGVGSPVL